MTFQLAKKSLFILSITGILGIHNSAMGQQKKEGNIQNDDIILEKERKIELKPEISRNFEPLVEIENLNKGRKMKYEFFERKWDSKSSAILTTSIIAPREGDELISSYGPKFKNMVKIGAGNYGHTLLNAHFGFTPKENQYQGIYVNHDANRRGPVGTAYSARNENEVKLYSKTFTGNYLLDGSIGYKRTEANYYGRDERYFNNIVDNNLGIVYNKFHYSGSIGNAQKDAKYDYLASSGLTYLSTSNSAREWIWESKIQSILHVNDQISAYLNGDMILSEITNAANNRRELYRIKPSFLYKNDRVSLTAGINISTEKDKLASLNQTRVFPVAKLDFKPTEFLHVFAGIGGDTYFNSMTQFVAENPWLGNQVTLKNTVQSTNIYGGLKGSNERNFDFEFKFGYSEFSNLGFFTSTKADTSKYDVIYAGGDKKVQVINLSGQINYQIFDKILSIIKYDFNSYQNLGELEKPFHKPALNLSFTNSITFKDKLIVSPDLFYLGGLYGYNPTNAKSINMPDIIDLNLKVNYLITKKFNASVSANNILGKNYQRYLFYSQQSLNYTVGLAYSF